jgi:hypothetical protein
MITARGSGISIWLSGRCPDAEFPAEEERAMNNVVKIEQYRQRWRAHFPNGRFIFYEGDDPEGFVEEIKAAFGFDPSVDENWGRKTYPDGDPVDPANMWKFHCPPEHLDAIYGNDRFPMGS